MKQMQPITSYIWGFCLSIILTFLVTLLVFIHINSRHEVISHAILIPALLVCAVLQLLVQLLFFLHLGNESRPRWHAIFFISTFFGILLIVVGSIWIMGHLNYNMTPTQINQYIQNQSGF